MQQIKAPDDRTVIEALHQGDEGAFADNYHASLSRVARLYIADRAVADEVVQDTWLGVIQGVWAFEAARHSRPGFFASSSTVRVPVRHVKDASYRSRASRSRSGRRRRSRLTASSPLIIRPSLDNGHSLPPTPEPLLSVGSWPGRHENASRTPSRSCPSISAWS